MEAYDMVVKHADAAMEYFPNQAILYFFSGTANQMLGKYQDAVNVLETGKKFALEEDLIVLFQGQLGDSYNSLGMYEKSELAYETALQYDPTKQSCAQQLQLFSELKKL